MYRSLEFARFLPEFGWEPLVLTVRPETMREPGILDPQPLGLLSPGTRIERTSDVQPLQAALRLRNRFAGGGEGQPAPPASAALAEEPPDWRDWISDLFSLPDRQVGWFPGAAAAALGLLERETVSAIYSSSPPASGHLAALAASRLSGVPWVADFRDPWVTNDFVPLRRTGFLDPIDRCLEGRVVSDADRLVLNTEELRSDFRERYPDLAWKFVTIPNGFDPEEEIPRPNGPSGTRPFTITHAGTLYGHRDPTPILEALSALVARGDLRPSEIRLRFLGSVAGPERWSPAFAAGPLSESVRFEPKVARADALRALASSDLLLLIQTGTELQVPRKLFEYLAVGKPILALVSGGATENLLRKDGLAEIVHPDRREEIERAILRAVRGAAPPSPGRPARFDFRNLTRDLVGLLEEVAR